ncbi:MAG: DNA primase [Candidatus Saelkia tenebricola]|nr:DNA primase [Candidatus Saelkia tenebricola]
MAIPENIINEVRDRADIVEIIDSYIHLKKTGGNFKALCPFHPEKTPSFVVSPQKQIFHCFGCGEGGNVFHFLIKHQNLSFVDAVKQVAAIVGIEVPHQDTDYGLQDLFDLNKIVSDFYLTQLNADSGKKCSQYLKSRGIKEDIIKLFKLGAAPNVWSALIQHLKSKKYSMETLIKAGLVLRAKDQKNYYDLFRDRVMFPILDSRNKVVGFGGRVLSEGLPKYLNSPQTPVYKKGKILYGINITLEHIKKERSAVVVEGYLDIISLYQAGIKNTVASLGTALTHDQVKFLKKYLDEVIIVYDGDQSGQIASLRGLDIVFESGIKAKAVMLPKGYDPDSFIREKGKNEFLKLLEMKKDVFDYKLDILLKVYGKDSLDSRIKIVNEMFSSLNKTGDYLIKADYMKKLASNLGFEEKVLWEQFNSKTQQNAKIQFNKNVVRQKQYASVEASLLYIMLTRVELIPELMKVVSHQEFITGAIQSLVRKIYDLYPDKERLKIGNLLNLVTDDEAGILSEIMAEDLDLHEDVFEDHLNQCIVNLKIMKIKNYCKFLEQEIKKAQDICDDTKVNVLFKELNEIKKKEVEI